MTDDGDGMVTLRFSPADALEVARELFAAASEKGDEPIRLSKGDETIEFASPEEAVTAARQLMVNASRSRNIDPEAYGAALNASDTFLLVGEVRRQKAREEREQRRVQRRARNKALLLQGVSPHDLPKD